MKISGHLSNAGRFDAHIERATFKWNASSEGNGVSRTLSCSLPSDHIQGMALPLPLPAQTGQEFTVIDLGDIDLGLSIALHDRRHAILTFHTASGKTAKATIKYR